MIFVLYHASDRKRPARSFFFPYYRRLKTRIFSELPVCPVMNATAEEEFRRSVKVCGRIARAAVPLLSGGGGKPHSPGRDAGPRLPAGSSTRSFPSRPAHASHTVLRS